MYRLCLILFVPNIFFVISIIVAQHIPPVQYAHGNNAASVAVSRGMKRKFWRETRVKILSSRKI